MWNDSNSYKDQEARISCSSRNQSQRKCNSVMQNLAHRVHLDNSVEKLDGQGHQFGKCYYLTRARMGLSSDPVELVLGFWACSATSCSEVS